MNASAQRRMVHLVGSIPFRDEDEVFRTASEILGDYLKRIPDGETGLSGDWIGWQTGPGAVRAHSTTNDTTAPTNTREGARTRSDSPDRRSDGLTSSEARITDTSSENSR